MRLRLVVLSFIALLTGLTGHSLAAGDEKIRLIQYNVKGSENGWVTGSPNITYKLNLISDVIMNNSVDFITLEEADKKDGDVPSPLLSDELKVQGVSGWKTISSSCNKDVVQITYSSQWTLVAQLGSGGHAAGFGWAGCNRGDGRPYDIGLFKNKTTNRSILIIATHLPHCHAMVSKCADGWSVGKFNEDKAKILSLSRNSDVVVIITGDMNEIGESATNDELGAVFTLKNLKKSKYEITTCCKHDGWRYHFDHVATTGPNAPTVDVIKAPKEAERYFAEKEHRMIYSEVLLSR